MIRLTSTIGDKVVPLKWERYRGSLLIWSQCQEVSRAAPITVIHQNETHDSVADLVLAVQKAGYKVVEIKEVVDGA